MAFTEYSLYSHTCATRAQRECLCTTRLWHANKHVFMGMTTICMLTIPYIYTRCTRHTAHTHTHIRWWWWSDVNTPPAYGQYVVWHTHTTSIQGIHMFASPRRHVVCDSTIGVCVCVSRCTRSFLEPFTTCTILLNRTACACVQMHRTACACVFSLCAHRSNSAAASYICYALVRQPSVIWQSVLAWDGEFIKRPLHACAKHQHTQLRYCSSISCAWQFCQCMYLEWRGIYTHIWVHSMHDIIAIISIYFRYCHLILFFQRNRELCAQCDRRTDEHRIFFRPASIYV